MTNDYAYLGYEPEIDLDNLEYEDPETVMEAIRGEYGPEAQGQVLQVLGIELEDAPAPVETGGWEHDFNHEVGRLAQRIGREPSSAEVAALLNDVGPNGEIPDLAERHGAQLADRTREDLSRKDLMAEVMDEADFFNQQEADAGGEGDLAPQEAGE